MKTVSPQSPILPEVRHGEKRPGVIDSAAYAQGVRVADVEIADISEQLKHEDRFVWVGLYEPEEKLLREIQEEFGLHDLAIEDAHSAHQRPKLEQYDNCLFVVLRTAHLAGEPQHVEFGETHVFVGLRYVVSVRHGSLQSHVGLRARCEASQRLLAKGPGFVLYALMDFVVDQYLPIVEALEEQVVELEEVLFGEKFVQETTSRIYHLKRELLSIKRAVSPLVDVCSRLMRFDLDLVPEDTKPYFRDVYDHAIRINEMVDTLRELLATALEANLSIISVSQNKDTKRLAAWAAIIAAPTAIAGIYGMNFQFMPELGWRYGYWVVLGVIAVVCSGLWLGFKRSGWL
ncbi:MAG TPA: magnesium/cobalt transporter CorA [Terrimicrobiaceae bacterium]|nr:magnesium/cobalt transporter CorA [Terrimicrobiaceae bacterium]